jgi:hypothetical protein
MTNEQQTYQNAEVSAFESRLFSAQRWARNVANNNPHQSGSFVLRIATAFLNADPDNQRILEPALTSLRHKYPTWDIAEADHER